jgi:hypothetical protein
MKTGFTIMAMGIAALTLSACKIDSDWERNVSAQQNNEQRVEWLKDMQALSNGNVLVGVETIAVGANRSVDTLLSELDKQGNTVWQQLFDLGENENIAQLLVSGENYYALVNTPDGKTNLLAVNAQGQQRWLYSYQDGMARSMQLIADKIYITGKRTQVLDTSGKMLVDIHQSEQTWAVEVGLMGDFYVAGAKGVTAYDTQGNQLWFLANTESGLSQQVDLVWQAGALYLAVSEMQGSKAWLKKVNTFLGTAEWQRMITSPSSGSNLLEGPVLMEAPETGNVVLVQSYERGRQLTMLDNRGRTQWQAQQDSGVARDVAINDDDELIVTGNGATEQFSMQGERLAWASLSGSVQSTTGEVEVFGKSIYVGASIYRDGKIQAVVAHYTDQ